MGNRTSNPMGYAIVAPDEGSLFARPVAQALPAAARISDPSTSHAAAERVTKSGQRQTNTLRVIELVERFPGRTSMELAALESSTANALFRAGLSRHEIARRLPDAELQPGRGVKRGDKKVCLVSNNSAITWWPKE